MCCPDPLARAPGQMGSLRLKSRWEHGLHSFVTGFVTPPMVKGYIIRRQASHCPRLAKYIDYHTEVKKKNLGGENDPKTK
jgi:hypothetical protein